MSRMVWVAVGAAGGIFAYKRVTKAVEDARERGLVGNVNAAATTASAFVGSVRQLTNLSDEGAAKRGVSISRRGGPTPAMQMDPTTELPDE